MRKTLRVILWAAAILGAIVVVLRLTVISWWTIPTDDPPHGASLAPNLFPGDLVLMYRHTPTFGDLARCSDPDAPGRFVVARVVGEPGDIVEVEGNDVVVNNKRGVQEHPCTPVTMSIADPSSGAPVELHCAYEALINHKHKRLTSIKGGQPQKRKMTVSDGNLYLVSDNRAFPMDSREYGALPKSSCKEQVFFRISGVKGLGDSASRFTYIQ
jgi:signal peptidase I